MGSLGGEVAKKKAMWLYPRVAGLNPSERWGHSACYCNGLVYVFGGCCGGMHFSDVLVLNPETMDWSTLMTKGQGPGPRDSHSAVIVGYRMIVFGGTNGSEKVNDIHMLDLRSKEWSRPQCRGIPPSPRESHTATSVSDEKLLIFGGSGEGEANYLNDLHVLDLKTMRWASPEVRENVPVPRDSHSAVVIGKRLFLYGGDSGDRYQGDVNVLDMETLTWSRMEIHGPSPGARAGHASVNFGTKVYVIGGVANKQYYSDVWVLDIVSCSWTQLDVCGQKPQGRFSHTAVFANSDITVFGGCGEDERPLNELLILQLGVERDNGLYKMPAYRTSVGQCNQESKRFLREAENNLQNTTILMGINENLVVKDPEELKSLPNKSFCIDTDTLYLKRRRTNNSKLYATESEAEEHSLSLSQSSSPSPSDQEQTPVKKATEVRTPQVFPIFKEHSTAPINFQSNHVPLNQPKPQIIIPRTQHDLHIFGEHPRLDNLHAVNARKRDAYFQAEEHRSLEARQFQNLIGAEVLGKVDGAFDSGYLMTATVNGKIFRGILFAPGPYLVSRGVNHGHWPSSVTNHAAVTHVNNYVTHSSVGGVRQSQQPMKLHAPEFQLAQVRRPSSVVRSPPSSDMDQNHTKELQGVVLSLGGPGNGNGIL